MFAKAVRPLMKVHRTAAQKALGSSSSALVPISSSASALSSGPALASCSGSAKGPHVSSARNRPLLPARQPSPIGTSTDASSTAYATPDETMEQYGMYEVNQNVLGDAQSGGTPASLVMQIRSGRSSVSSVSGAPSPAIHGKDMERMKQLAEE